MVARAIESAESAVPMQVVRLTVDLIRAAPFAPVEVEVEVRHAGTSTEVVEARLQLPFRVESQRADLEASLIRDGGFMRLVSSSLRSFGLVLALTACGGADEAASTGTTLSSNDPMSTGGEVAPTAANSGTLRLSGPAGTRMVGGALSSDYADMITWDPGQGRLVAYFGGGDAAFGLTLNLGEPFSVGSRRVATGPVVFEAGESFGQRIDVRDASVTVTALDVDARTIALRIDGTTSPADGQAPEAFVLEANVVLPARRE